jgi:peptidoglycan hydrolase CwlO-like protein
MKKKTLFTVITISVISLMMIGCTVPAKLGEYVTKAYNVSNDLVGVLKGVQEDPTKITDVIDSLVDGASTIRDALYKAGSLLGEDLEEPKTKSLVVDLETSTQILKDALAEE